MHQSWKIIKGDADCGLLLIADHASNQVPDGINLGIDPALLDLHIAVDLGVAELATTLNARIGMPAVLGGVSRLVVDLNREEDAPNIIPETSDGHAIPGNRIDDAARATRIAQYWHPYHDRVAGKIARLQPRLLVSLHSFTPQLAADPDQKRPWQIGILYNRDDRAARIAIPALAAMGVIVGDQLPYSGVLLNATMNRHGEANDIAYLGIEMRQDLLSNPADVSHWADVLAPVILQCRDAIFA